MLFSYKIGSCPYSCKLNHENPPFHRGTINVILLEKEKYGTNCSDANNIAPHYVSDIGYWT